MKRFHLRSAFAAVPLLSLCAGVVFAQQLPVPQPGLPTQPTVVSPGLEKDDVEVLARGPVHEAYAATAEVPTEGGPVLEKRPPDPVEELPPDQKPDGDNVQWIPGYWQWDEERKDYIWISGFWRNAPPGRVWVPGGWREVRGGYQWVSGFWNVAGTAAQPQAELEYLPPPPATLETGPTIVAPGDDYFYTPGSWMYRTNRYVWRPGFWVEHRRNWLWVPDHFRWTPYGYVFIPGYWDVPLERRGVLFAPVYFRAAVLTRPRFVYTPIYAVPPVSLQTSLFIRRGWGGYYFGDYFEQRYVTAGYSSWAGASFRGSNFAVNISVGRSYTYDPLWSYYSLSYRSDPRWQANITNVYAGRYKGDIPRPPHTLVQQNTVVNNITNVTNNTNVIVNNNSNNTTNNKTVNTAPTVSPVMLATMADIKKADPSVAALKTVQADDRVKEQKLSRDIQQVAVERRKAENQLGSNGIVAPKANDKPRQVKMDLPTTVTARAQIPTEPAKAPPPPAVAGAKRVNPEPAKPVVPTPGATIPTTPGTPPKVDPPKPGTPPTPPKVDPLKPGTPVMPKPDPGAKPPVTPPVNPLPGTPKPVDPPKPTDPKTPVTPPTTPVKPPVVAPPMPPKVDPPKGPPKTDPPKVPAPVIQPPVAPPPATKPPELPKPIQPPVTVPMPPKVDPKPPVVAPMPPKVDPPKAPAPVVNPPSNPPKAPAPVINPPPAAPPKPPATVNPPMTNPRPGPGAPPTRPTPTGEKPKEKKDDKK